MHVDSQLSANNQFADWVAACVGRAIDYQLVDTSRYEWIARDRHLGAIRGTFTLESKLHLHHRAVEDLNHSQIFDRVRPLYPLTAGTRVGDQVGAATARRIKAAAERAPRARQS